MSTLHTSAAALLGASLLLSACSESSSSDAPAPIPVVSGTEVPLSATQSAAGALAFVAQQQAMSSDSSEPIVLGDAVLATDDSAEPGPV